MNDTNNVQNPAAANVVYGSRLMDSLIERLEWLINVQIGALKKPVAEEEIEKVNARHREIRSFYNEHFEEDLEFCMLDRILSLNILYIEFMRKNSAMKEALPVAS